MATASVSDVDELSDDMQGQQHDKREKFTDDHPFETAWKDFEICLLWRNTRKKVPVYSNEISHPCNFQYAFLFDKKQIEDTLRKEGLKISYDLKSSPCFEIDAINKGYASAHDACSCIHDLFTGHFSRYTVITLPINSEKGQIVTDAYREQLEESPFKNVACFIEKDANVIHMVGYDSCVNNVLKELKIEMVDTECVISKDTWERLLPEQLIRNKAHVQIDKMDESVRIYGDVAEVGKVKQILKNTEDNLFKLVFEFEEVRKNKLLIENGNINLTVFAFFQHMLQKRKFDVFSEMSIEDGKAMVRLQAKSEEAITASYNAIKESIVEFSLDQNEAVCAQEDLKAWSKKRKLITFMKTRTVQNIVCTADVAEQILTIDCSIEIPLPNLVCSYLDKHCNEIIENLRTEFQLKDAQVCPTQHILKVCGHLGKVQEFRKRLMETCRLCTLTIRMPATEFVNNELPIKAIGESHGCINAEKVVNYWNCSFKNCSLAAEWHMFGYAGNELKVYVIVGDINNIDVNKNVCKLQFVNKSFKSLQDIPMKQHEFHHEQFDVYKEQIDSAKLVYWHDIRSLPLTDGDWSVEIVVKNVNRFSQSLCNVFREAAEKKCPYIVIPLELRKSFSPSDVAGACIEELTSIQYEFQVIFQCHKVASITEVTRRVETHFKKQDKLCIREDIHPGLKPNIDLSSIVVTLDTACLTSLPVDVIVNTVSRNLNLSLGFLSKSILKNAGDEIQQECREKYNSGIQFGEIAVTSAGKMKHTHIFHCALPPFQKHSVAENVKSMVWKCLVEADRRQCRSIAFPAFGTGKLRYPPRETARAMLEAVDEFKRRALNSCLQKVIISVPNTSGDIYNISKVFCNEHCRRQRRLLSTNGNGIADCHRLSTAIGAGIQTIDLHVMAKECANMLSSQFVIIILGQKEPADGWCLIQMDEDLYHDRCLVKCFDNEKPMSHFIKEVLKYLCALNVSDIAIASNGITTDFHQFVLAITQVLQQLMKESDKNSCSLYLQNIVVLVEDKLMPFLIKHLCSSSKLSSFVSSIFKPVWLEHTVSDINIGFTILGRIDQDTSEVKRKLTNWLEINSIECIDHNEGKDEGTDVDKYMAKNLTGQLTSEKMPTEDVLESTNDFSQTNESFEEMVTAELNPGLVKFLETSPMFELWQDYVQRHFEVTLKCEENAMFVCGSFEAILSFETFLEKNTVNDCDDESQQNNDEENVDIVDTKHDVDNESSSAKVGESSENSEEDVFLSCSDCNSDLSGDLGVESNAAHEESNDGIFKTGSGSNAVEDKDSLKFETNVSKMEGDIDSSGSGAGQVRSDDNQNCHAKFDGAEKSISQPDIIDIMSVEPVLSFKLKGTEVCILCGDLSKMRVDCIVNSANKHLFDTYGISKALSKAGGKDYNDAVENAKNEFGALTAGSCIDTISGTLPCKCVIHAVGTTFSTFENDHEQLQVLQETVENSLQLADRNGCVSVAMPIIGCGAGRILESHCASQYYRALEAFSCRQKTALKYVYLVEIDEKRIKNIATEFKQFLKDRSDDKLPDKETTGVRNVRRFQCGHRSVPVILMQTEDLTGVKADAIVCIENINAENGYVVSNLLRREAGPKYVEDLSKMKTKRSRDESVKCVNEIPLKCTKLLYKYVLFATIPKWSKDGVKPDLSTIVHEAVVKATDLKCQSVNIPIAGRTENGTPVRDRTVWNHIVEGLRQYVADKCHSTAIEIKLVCQTRAVFEHLISELSKYFSQVASV